MRPPLGRTARPQILRFAVLDDDVVGTVVGKRVDERNDVWVMQGAEGGYFGVELVFIGCWFQNHLCPSFGVAPAQERVMFVRVEGPKLLR